MVDPQLIYNVNSSNSARRFTPRESLPKISTRLDSVRTYQFEVQISFPANVANLLGDYNIDRTDYTLAAKQITSPSVSTEEIAVYRVNDTVYYPGRASTEEITMTFDNLYKAPVAGALMKWFRATSYDYETGDQSQAAPGGTGIFKSNYCKIIQFDNTRNPIGVTELYGLFPKKYSLAEFNYSTNEFHTIEVTFRYDFMNNYSYRTVEVGPAPAG